MQLSSGTAIIAKKLSCGCLAQVMTKKNIKIAKKTWVCSKQQRINVLRLSSHGRGGRRGKRERAVSVRVTAKTGIEVFVLFYSCSCF